MHTHKHKKQTFKLKEVLQEGHFYFLNYITTDGRQARSYTLAFIFLAYWFHLILDPARRNNIQGETMQGFLATFKPTTIWFQHMQLKPQCCCLKASDITGIKNLETY